MLSFEEVNILGQILNDTFGIGSTTTNATSALKSSLEGDILSVMGIEVINLVDYHHAEEESKKSADQLDQRIDAFIREVKKSFKDEAGRALKCNLIKGSESTDVEIINYSAYSAKRSAYVRRRMNFKCE